jgi:hypothetical protein
MATGVVKRMHKGMVNTPNEGVLIDYSTGREYPFRRPDLEFGKVPRTWNVHTHDVVSFTLTGNVATGVVLYKKFQNGTVYGSFPIFTEHSFIEGTATGHSSILGIFGGKLRLIGATDGGSAI